MSFIDKFKSFSYVKPILAVFIIVLLLVSYRVYIWTNTQSTDNAYIEADISNVSAEVNGIINKVFIQENSHVEKGEIIAKVQDHDYKAKFTKAEALLEGSEHDIQMIEQDIKLSIIERNKAIEVYDFAEENLKNSETDYKRIVELSKDNYASQKNLGNTKISFERAKSDLSQAVLNMQLSAEKLALLEIKRLAAISKHTIALQERNLAKRELDNTEIRAPISGMVGNSSLREGNYVRAGGVLFSVVPLDKLYVKANFKETQISKFKPGMNAEIIIDSESGEKIVGIVRSISPATGAKFSLLPPANATGNFTKIVQRVPVLIDFSMPKNIKDRIVPGMSTLINIRTDQFVSDEV